MTRLLLPSLFALLLPACSSSGVPDCLVFTPVHVTTDGVVDVGVLTQGEVAEDVIRVETTAIEGAPQSSVYVEVTTSCDDAACEPDVSCRPGTLEPVGSTVTCDIRDDISGDTCSWSCQISLTATVLDDGACRDVFVVIDAVGEHDAVQVGR